MSLKQAIEKMHADLDALEVSARKLQNQNFADVVRSAKGRVHQITEHPDFDKAVDLHTGERGRDAAYLESFKAELADLERRGDGDSDRAKELRDIIKSAESKDPNRRDAAFDPNARPFPGSDTPLPGTAFGDTGGPLRDDSLAERQRALHNDRPTPMYGAGQPSPASYEGQRPVDQRQDLPHHPV
jgi:hypothetical protein